MNEKIYYPSEDSQFFVSFLEKRGGSYNISVDVGSGTGIVSLIIAKISNRVIAVDINSNACKYTWKKIKEKGFDDKVDIVCCDALTAIRKMIIFDLIVSNPPYLPCNGNDISVCGGERGIEIPLKLIKNSLDNINAQSKIYMVLSSLSDLEYFREELMRYNLSYKIVSMLKVGIFEDLYIYEIQKK